MTKRANRLAQIAGGILLSTAAFAAPPSPAMLANACGGCHGTNGMSVGPSMPIISAQSKIAFVEAMKGFKSGDRPSTVMGRIAKGYTDAEIDTMADFFVKQPYFASGDKVDPAKAANGKTLADRHCKRCHLENGKEYDENAAVVGGQWLTYLQIQMDDYMSGKRKMSEKKAEKMKPLSKQELDAIAHFYASVK